MEKKRILLILGIAMCSICIIKICTHKMHGNAIKKDEGSDLNKTVKTVSDANKVDDDKSKVDDDKSKVNDDKSKESEKTFRKRRKNKRKIANEVAEKSADEKNLAVKKAKISNENSVEKKSKVLKEGSVEKEAKILKEGSVEKEAKILKENPAKKKVMDKIINSVENKTSEKTPTKSKANNKKPVKSTATEKRIDRKKKRKSKRNMKKQLDNLIKIHNEPDKLREVDLVKDFDKLNTNQNEANKLIADQGEDVEIRLNDIHSRSFKPPLPPKPRNLSSPPVYFLPENSAKMDFLESCFRPVDSPKSNFSSFGHSQKTPKKTQDLSQILKYDPQIVNSTLDVLDTEIHEFVKIFTRNPMKKIIKVETELKNDSICFYRRGNRENDILSLFIFIARTDKESLNRDVRLQNIYKNLVMIYAGKYLQTLNLKDLTQTENEPEIDSFSSFTDSSSSDVSPVNTQKFYIALPKPSPIDLDFLSENFEVLLSEFYEILDDISEDNVALFQNLLNFLNCFYVRLKPRLDEYDDKDLIEIYKCMFEHLKIAVNMPENERKRLVGSGFN